jgi:hypothetical protein
MPQRHWLSFFWESFVGTILGLGIAFWLGYQAGGLPEAVAYLVTTTLLACLETSVSLDNAVVNAAVLRVMRPVWRVVFLTAGIAVAVFGMRILFPILITSVVGHVPLVDAWTIATTQPERYQALMEKSHVRVMGFGGMFLLMVALTYFLNENKKTHWIAWVEQLLARAGSGENAAASLAIGLVLAVTLVLPANDKYPFLVSALAGFAVHALIDVLKHLVGGSDILEAAAKNGLIGFVYLEILDSSFSFDGVVAAFAITNKFWLIALGLGIGALFVRSTTVYLVDRGTLETFVYLEPAAFWAIVFLVAVMFTSAAGHHLPGGEVSTALASLTILIAGVISSIKVNHRP